MEPKRHTPEEKAQRGTKMPTDRTEQGLFFGVDIADRPDTAIRIGSPVKLVPFIPPEYGESPLLYALYWDRHAKIMQDHLLRMRKLRDDIRDLK